MFQGIARWWLRRRERNPEIIESIRNARASSAIQMADVLRALPFGESNRPASHAVMDELSNKLWCGYRVLNTPESRGNWYITDRGQGFVDAVDFLFPTQLRPPIEGKDR